MHVLTLLLVWRPLHLAVAHAASCLPLQFFNAQTREHLVSLGGQQRPINLGDGTLRWERVERVRLQHQQQQVKTPGAGAGAGQHAKPHTPAGPKVNVAQVSTEPPAAGFRSPQTSVSLIGKRIRVWWPDDKAWYAGEVKVGHCTTVCRTMLERCGRLKEDQSAAQ